MSISLDVCVLKKFHIYSAIPPIFHSFLVLTYLYFMDFFFACYALPKLFAPTNQPFHVNVDFSASSDREGEGSRSKEGINGAKQ